MFSGKKSLTALSVFVILALLIAAVPVLSVAAAAGDITADDFHTALDTSLWTATVPAGSTVTSGITSGEDKVVRFHIPAGTQHIISNGDQSAPRILQAHDNGPFDMTVKFTTTPGTVMYASEGILIKGLYTPPDSPSNTYDTFVRFSLDTAATNAANQMDAYAAFLWNNNPGNNWARVVMSASQHIPVASTAPAVYLRVVRQIDVQEPGGTRMGSQFLMYYSTNGTNWTEVPLTSNWVSTGFVITDVGLYGGTTGSNPPEVTVDADYVINTGVPYPNEDQGTTPTTYTLGVVKSPAEGGTVTWLPEGTSFDAGTKITFTATPASGYVFDHWVVAPEGGTTTQPTTNPVDVTLNANTTVTAVFTQPSATYDLAFSASPGAGGTIAGATAGPIAAGTSVTLTATPNTDYYFGYWEINGVVDTTNRNPSLTFTMDKDYTLVGHFILKSSLNRTLLIPVIRR